MTRETWGSRLGFILATAGFAVGLGNVWRFSYVVGTNGGGAFLLLYVAFSLLIGIPLLTAEISLGRATRLTPISGMEALTGRAGHPWNLVGWAGIVTAVLLMSYYVMLVGWIIGYFVLIAGGRLTDVSPETAAATYESFVGHPGPVFGYTFAALTALGLVAAGGVRRGVERVARNFMPVLFVLLIVLAVRSLTFEGAGTGLRWYLAPDFSAIDASVVLAALGQSFFSIGIAMAAAFCFGSYLEPNTSDVTSSAVIVVAFDTGAAFLAGLVIFPALFAFGLEPDSGPGLLFVTMPVLFDTMPFGRLFGATFFLLLVIAGMTSAIAHVEVLAATLMDKVGMSRRRAVWVTVAGLGLLAIPIVLSQGPWSGVRVFDMDLFVFVDTVSGSYALPLSAFLLALFVAFGWGFDRFQDETNRGAALRIAGWWRPVITYLIPLAVGIIVLGGLGVLS